MCIIHQTYSNREKSQNKILSNVNMVLLCSVVKLLYTLIINVFDLHKSLNIGCTGYTLDTDVLEDNRNKIN